MSWTTSSTPTPARIAPLDGSRCTATNCPEGQHLMLGTHIVIRRSTRRI
ncbi:hypothetical protein ABT009_46090 [Streptomyces sp. NPDC002896]